MIYTGTILEIKDRTTYLMTMDCQFISLKTKADYAVGRTIAFTKTDLSGSTKTKQFPKKLVLQLVAAAATICLLATGAWALTTQLRLGATLDTTTALLVSLDINPSVELSLNKNQQVVALTSYNEDGEKIISDTDFIGKTLDESISTLLQTSEQEGYINKDNQHILLTAVDAQNTSDSLLPQTKESFDHVITAHNQLSIIPLYLEDPTIIESAKQNNLSIGKEALYQYAQSRNYSFSASDIQNASVSELVTSLDLLSSDGSTMKSISTNPSKQSDGVLNTTIAEIRDGISVRWTKPSVSQGFKYYKVVASKSNANPSYPQDGYALVISDFSTTSADLLTGTTYNGGDIGGTLNAGESYYFSVTYVYDTYSIYANSKKMTMPAIVDDQESKDDDSKETTEKTEKSKETDAKKKEATTKTTASSAALSVASSGDSLVFNWTPISSKSVVYNNTTYQNFQYYKIVASPNNPNPVYPNDGYLTYLTDYNSSSCTITPSSGNYNKSPELVAGQAYYFSITYVFENGKFTSNTVTQTVPAGAVSAEPTPKEEPKPTAPSASSLALSVSSEGGTLNFNFTPLGNSSIQYNGTTYNNFHYYKIVASATNPNPVYPNDGYLTYITDYNASSWSVQPAALGYNLSPQLVSGQAYYFSVTYVFENGKISSNTVQYIVP